MSTRTLLAALLLALPAAAQSFPLRELDLGLTTSVWQLPTPGLDAIRPALGLARPEWPTFSLAPLPEAFRREGRPAMALRLSNRLSFNGTALRVGVHAFVARDPQGNRLTAPLGPLANVPGKDLRLYLGTGIAF